MGYDAAAESVAIITGGITADPGRLSRRRRWAAVAVDVDGDVAATWFVRRGPGCVWHETHLLRRDGGQWRLLGGGGGSSDDDGLADRPPASAQGAHLLLAGGGATLDAGARAFPWWPRWIRTARLRVSAEVVSVAVGSRARMPAPRHGQLLVVWSSRHAPRVAAFDAAGHRVAAVRPPDEPGRRARRGHRRAMPLRYQSASASLSPSRDALRGFSPQTPETPGTGPGFPADP